MHACMCVLTNIFGRGRRSILTYPESLVKFGLHLAALWGFEKKCYFCYRQTNTHAQLNFIIDCSYWNWLWHTYLSYVSAHWVSWFWPIESHCIHDDPVSPRVQSPRQCFLPSKPLASQLGFLHGSYCHPKVVFADISKVVFSWPKVVFLQTKAVLFQIKDLRTSNYHCVFF